MLEQMHFKYLELNNAKRNGRKYNIFKNNSPS
jgi:hypothetical protein